MQNISFNSIEDFLEYLPENERIIVQYLRALALDAIPEVIEKLAYNVPYYYRHSRICFIWPASVQWGNVKLQGVQLGFCNGYLLHDTSGYLEKENRKKVLTKTFRKLAEIDSHLIQSYIYEAVGIDEMRWTKK